MAASQDVADSLAHLINKIRATPKDVGASEFRRIHQELREEIEASFNAPSYTHKRALQELWVDGHWYHTGKKDYLGALMSFYHGKCNNGCEGEECERARYNAVYAWLYFKELVRDFQKVIACPGEEVGAVVEREIEQAREKLSDPGWAIGVLKDANHSVRHCLHGADLKTILRDAA